MWNLFRLYQTIKFIKTMIDHFNFDSSINSINQTLNRLVLFINLIGRRCGAIKKSNNSDRVSFKFVSLLYLGGKSETTFNNVQSNVFIVGRGSHVGRS